MNSGLYMRTMSSNLFSFSSRATYVICTLALLFLTSLLSSEAHAAPEMSVTAPHSSPANREITDNLTSTSTASGTRFSSQPLVGGSQTFTYEIHNSGTDPLNLIGATPVTLTGDDTAHFSVTQPLLSVVPPASSTTFTVTFDPADTGPLSATVNIANDDADENPYNFAISGTGEGPSIQVRYTDLFGFEVLDGSTTTHARTGTEFGSVDVNGGTSSRLFQLRNIGTENLVLPGNVTISGAHAADFTVTQQPAGTLTPSQRGYLTIEFNPGAVGRRTALVTIANNDPSRSPFDFVIAGTGDAGAAEVQVTHLGSDIASNISFDFGDPSTYTFFGPVDANAIAVDKVFRISNIGTAPLTLGPNAASILNNTAGFSVLAQPASVIQPGQSSDVIVRFTSRLGGTITGLLINSDDADESTFYINLYGLGVASAAEIDVTGNGQAIIDGDSSPSTADHTDFGAADIATDTISRTYTIQNPGSSVLTLGANAASLSGPDAGEFSITTQPSATIAAGSSSTLVVTYNPSAVGSHAATLNIASDDADENPYNFAIAGTGTTVGGGVTIVLNVVGPDTNLDFTSATGALNLSLNSVSGTAQSNVTGIAPGTHRIVAADLSALGYGISAISCSDDDSTTDPAARSATIRLAANESVTCTFTLTQSRDVTSQMIVDYLSARNTLILRNQADRTRRLARLQQGASPRERTASVTTPLGFVAQLPSPMALTLNEGLLSYSASAQEALSFFDNRTRSFELPQMGRWDIWSEGRFNIFDDKKDQSGQFGIVHFGADYLLSKDILLGAKAQIDWMDQTFAATTGKVSGTGFMVGPYATVALTDSLFLDLSSTWGMSENSISPFGTYKDQFTTNRWMVDGSLTGQYVLDRWTLHPTLAFAYIEEYQSAYTDSLNVRIPDQTVAQGQVSFAPRLSYTAPFEKGGALTSWLETKGQYAFNRGEKPSNGSFGDANTGLSASVETGLDLNLHTGSAFSLSGKYDGVGTNTTSYGVKLGIRLPLN